MSSEARCGRCGALVTTEADWCGQCFAPLRQPERPEPDLAVASPAPARDLPGPGRVEPGAPEAPATWRCPRCEQDNPISANACRVCGTSFGALFEDAPRPAELSPAVAAASSLVLAGLGHWRLGRRADAVARFVLDAWIVGTLLVLLGSRSDGGFGPVGALVAVYGVSTVALWATSALDAARLAGGDEPVVSSRALLWGAVTLVVASIVLATVFTLPGAATGGTGGAAK